MNSNDVVGFPVESFETICKKLKNKTEFNCDRHPCWYATFKKADKLEDYTWEVGCKKEGGNVECSIQLSKYVNLSDRKIWEYVISKNFYIKLIELFKLGQEQSIVDWATNGMGVNL